MIQSEVEIKICIISVWFGPWPSYLPFFLKTCTANNLISWILVTDQEIQDRTAENIAFKTMSKQAFIKTASEKLGFDISLDDSYKLCDLKPTFGTIFEDLLSGYHYWGYCDIDLVFGEIRKQILPLLEEGPDIVSGYPNFLAGPFSLFRNTHKINNLFRDCPDHQQILQDPSHRAFDENIPRKIPFVTKCINRIQYLISLVVFGPRYHFNIPEIRYNFQWFAKKRMSYKYPSQDMTELVFKASHKKSIKVVFRDLIKSDRAYARQGRKGWKISWQDGKVKDVIKGEDLFAFHFIDSKNDPGFVNNGCIDNLRKFTITEHKIECK